jgi:hypothetical protein
LEASEASHSITAEVFPDNSEIIFMLGDRSFEPGVFLLCLRQLFLQVLCFIIGGRDLPKIAVEDGRSKEGLQVENTVLDQYKHYSYDNQVWESLPRNAWLASPSPCLELRHHASSVEGSRGRPSLP